MHASVTMSRLDHFPNSYTLFFVHTCSGLLKEFVLNLEQIINSDNVQEAARETEGYFIKSGIVTVIKDALIPSGTLI